VAERAKAAGVGAVVFDRGGNQYHGRVAAVADGAREGGCDACDPREAPRNERRNTDAWTSAPRTGGPAGGDNSGRRDRRDRESRGGRDGGADKTAFVERVVTINRVAKVVKGGRRFSFTALVVVGDGDGTVGVGYGKAKEVPAAIAKGVEEAKKHFFKVPRIQGTIRTRSRVRTAAGVVLLRPASPGTGVIAVARCAPSWSAPASTTC
jgi:hypothetical protein